MIPLILFVLCLALSAVKIHLQTQITTGLEALEAGIAWIILILCAVGIIASVINLGFLHS